MSIKNFVKFLLPADTYAQLAVARYRWRLAWVQGWGRWRLTLGFGYYSGWRRWRLARVAARADQILRDQLGIVPARAAYLFQIHFFAENGIDYYSGGAERYLIDLAVVLRERGYQPVVIQLADDNGRFWINHQHGLPVLGIPSLFSDFPGVIGELTSPALAIYSGYAAWALAKRIHFPRLLISHCVMWDKPGLAHVRRDLRLTLSQFDTIVSVDTNTISLLRTDFADQLQRRPVKFHYVPNYVDRTQFRPATTTPSAPSSSVIITVPRRLSRARGFWLLSPLIPEILDDYPAVQFRFVGFVHDSRIAQRLAQLQSRYGARIDHQLLDQDQMPEVYRQTSISLIPTLHTEGTSLSCLEAMACGNAVIATNVGGLPNLIIDHYNGLLINPDTDQLRTALRELLDQPALRRELAGNGLRVAAKFDQQIWQSRWRQIIDAVAADSPTSN